MERFILSLLLFEIFDVVEILYKLVEERVFIGNICLLNLCFWNVDVFYSFGYLK